MQISLLLMEEIAKLFAIMLMGYAVVKAGLMKSSESKSISVVMVYLVIPCVIIKCFSGRVYTGCTEGTAPGHCVAAVAGTYPVFDAYHAILRKYSCTWM